MIQFAYLRYKSGSNVKDRTWGSTECSGQQPATNTMQDTISNLISQQSHKAGKTLLLTQKRTLEFRDIK